MKHKVDELQSFEQPTPKKSSVNKVDEFENLHPSSKKRFKFPENSVSLYAAKVQNRGLSAVAQCESLRYKLLNGLAVRRACYGVLRFIMESGAKGCEVVVSGKLRAARAKSMKFTVSTTIQTKPSATPI